MLVAFNWSIRPYLHEFKGANLAVLVNLMLRANERMRCWPGMDTIAKDIGYSIAPTSEAKQWLVERGALMLVPYDKRMGEEEHLPPRQHVYQLTGVIRVNGGKKIPYLVMTPEAIEAVNVLINKTLENKTLDSKVLKTKTEGSTSLKGKSKNKGNSNNPRKRDVIFDALAIHLFQKDINDKAQVIGCSGQVVVLKKKLLEMYPDISAEIIAEKLAGFPEWYHKQPATKDAALPTSKDKFPNHFSTFMANGNGKSNGNWKWYHAAYALAYHKDESDYPKIQAIPEIEIISNVIAAWECMDYERDNLIKGGFDTQIKEVIALRKKNNGSNV